MSWFSDNAPTMDVAKGGGLELQRQAMMRSPAVASRGTTSDRSQTGARMVDSSGSSQYAGDPFRQQIADALMQGYGKVDPAQVEYFVKQRDQSAAEGDPRDDNYWSQRAMGWQAGGADAATQGPYAGGQAGPGAAGGGMSSGGGYGTMGSMGSTGMPQGWSTSGSRLAPYSSVGLSTPWTEQFSRPDPNQILSDKSYQFQRDQGMQALERSAAGHGTLLTGGFAKDAMEFGQGLASTFDDKYYNRALGEYQMDKGTFNDNKDSAYRMLSGLAGNGQQAASSYGSNVADLYSNNALANASLIANGGNINARTTAGQADNNANLYGNLADLGSSALTAYNNRTRKPKTPATGTAINNPVGYDESL